MPIIRGHQTDGATALTARVKMTSLSCHIHGVHTIALVGPLMDEQLRRKVIKRSRGMCEMMIDYGTGLGAHRCTNPATEIHHMLTKGRGGVALDRVQETYHLLHLCRPCHMASDGASAYEGGFLIEGSAVWDNLMQRPKYTGPDQYLSEKYG